MASNSGRRSGSSGASSSRRRVVIGAEETVRVQHKKDRTEIESERKRTSRSTQRAASERTGSRVPRPSSAGVRVASQKREERDHRRTVIARRRFALGAAAVVAVAAIAWGAVALWQAPILPIKSVTVTGTKHLTNAEVVALSAIPADATLLRLSERKVAEHVYASPWIADVKVRKVFPSSVRIDVTERVPAAFVDTGAHGIWLVAGDGYWIVRRSKEPSASLLLVRDVPESQPTSGTRSGSPVITNALQVIAGLSPELKKKVKFVSAATIEKTLLVLKNDVQVFIGSSEDIQKKDIIARTILARQKNLVYVNVRVTDRPTWRGLNPGN